MRPRWDDSPFPPFHPLNTVPIPLLITRMSPFPVIETLSLLHFTQSHRISSISVLFPPVLTTLVPFHLSYQITFISGKQRDDLIRCQSLISSPIYPPPSFLLSIQTPPLSHEWLLPSLLPFTLSIRMFLLTHIYWISRGNSLVLFQISSLFCSFDCSFCLVFRYPSLLLLFDPNHCLYYPPLSSSLAFSLFHCP